MQDTICTDPHKKSILSYALYYAETMQWAVFPAPPGEKSSHKAARFSDGRKWGATKDAEEIRRDFAHWPDSNIGIPTGAQNGIFVIDVDTPTGHDKDGIASLAALETEHGKLPPSLQAVSPSGSIHYYFRHPGFHVKNSTSEIGSGIDIRGDGGMVIAPPSIKGAGEYEWRNGLPIADAPQWLLDMIKSDKVERKNGSAREAPTGLRPLDGLQAAKALKAACENVVIAECGTRNGALNKESFAVGRYVGSGEIGLDVASHDLLLACEENGLLGEDGEQQCLATIRSGLAAGAKEPAVTSAEMFDEVAAAIARGETWSPPLVPAGPLPPGTPPPGPCDLDAYDEPAESIRPRRIDAASLEGKPIPEREWLVRDLIPAKNVTLLYGDGGTGKSLLALQMGAAIVLGTHFFGRQVTRGPVEFITAEDSLDEMHRRLAAIVHTGGFPMGALSGLHLTSLAESDALLAVPQDNRGGALATTALYAELESIIAESRPEGVFLDTLADVYGGNEIVRAQVRQFIGMLRRLAMGYGCTIVVLAHPSLAGMDKGTSGSTGWSNSVRSRIYLKRIYEKDGREPDEDARALSVGKLNYGRVGLEIPMRWQSGVLVPMSVGPTGDPMVAAAKADRVFVELLRKYMGQNQYVSMSTGKSFAPFIFAKDAAVQGVNKAALTEAMKRLVDAGTIENAPHGAASKKMFRLYVAPTSLPTPANAC
jgi:RecA-family ATPase